jgi:hypothetical protein
MRKGSAFVDPLRRPGDPPAACSALVLGCEACGAAAVRELPREDAALLAMLRAHVAAHARGRCVAPPAGAETGCVSEDSNLSRDPPDHPCDGVVPVVSEETDP